MSANPLLIKFPDTQFILGSQSPRRKELLEGLGIPFGVRVSNINEALRPNLNRHEIPLYLSRKKSEAFDLLANEILVTADTIVYCDDKVLEKPENAREAAEMLRFLSGKTHQVYSAFCIRSSEKIHCDWDETHVQFRELTESEISHYIHAFEPYDKAGAYGIQEWLGYTGISEIRGSYYTVMGLPVHKVYTALMQF